MERVEAELVGSEVAELVGLGAAARVAASVAVGQEEAELVGEVPGSEMVVKLGPRGVRAGGVTHAARPVRAVDATGAGDAFAAGYLLGGVRLGLDAAARAVTRLGAMP